MITIKAIALVSASAAVFVVLMVNCIVKKVKRWNRTRKHNKLWKNPDYRRQWMNQYIAETKTM